MNTATATPPRIYELKIRTLGRKAQAASPDSAKKRDKINKKNQRVTKR